VIEGLGASDIAMARRMGVNMDEYVATYAEEKKKTDARFAALAAAREAAQSETKTPAAEPSVTVTLSPAASAAIKAAPAATASSSPPSTAAPAAAPIYAKGSAESENVQMATGLAKAARNNIETLNMGSSVYNSATKDLADAARIDAIRKKSGDRYADLFVESSKILQRAGLLMMSGLEDKMRQEFTVTGTPLTRTEDGLFKVGDYVQATSGDGWSVSVKSTGEALAIANGLDVSAQVDDSSATGVRWSQAGQLVNKEI
jgi:hypothetical protein